MVVVGECTAVSSSGGAHSRAPSLSRPIRRRRVCNRMYALGRPCDGAPCRFVAPHKPLNRLRHFVKAPRYAVFVTVSRYTGCTPSSRIRLA